MIRGTHAYYSSGSNTIVIYDFDKGGIQKCFDDYGVGFIVDEMTILFWPDEDYLVYLGEL